MSIFPILLIIAFASLVTSEGVDCATRPSIETIFFRCCSLQRPRFDDFESQCRMAKTMIPKPCQMKCLFDTGRVLNGTKLVQPNLRRMLANLFDNATVVEAYHRAFLECESIIAQGGGAWRVNSPSRGLRGDDDACEPHAFFYSLCARTRIIKHCPAWAWFNSEKCQRTREFVESCEREIALLRFET